MGFSRDFIDKVRDSSDIVELISQYTVLNPSGSNHMGKCPFPDHNDKTASFSVSHDKQLFHCFGCKKSGTIFNFVQMYLGMGFPETIEYLAQRAGIPIEQDEKYQRAQNSSRDHFFECNQIALDAFRNRLKAESEDSPVKKYLQKRGLSAEMIDEFQLGYAPESWDFVFQKIKKYPDSILNQCGLVKPRKEKNGFYDRFRDRLMFPIVNTMGKCVGFGGRILEQGEPKYLNSPETPLFHKSKVLYGLDRNARYIRNQDEAILVEGYMDLIALAQFEVRNVAANLGTALTSEHAKLISRMTKNVLVLFDGDEAGQRAAEKSLPILLRAGLRPRGLVLPGGNDPDDFIRQHGKEQFLEHLSQAPELFEMIVTKWLKGYTGSATDKMRLIEKVAPVVVEMADRSLRQLYLSDLASKINVDPNWLRSALWNQVKDKVSQPSQQYDAPPPQQPTTSSEHVEYKLKDAAIAELTLLGLALKSTENFNLIQDSDVSDYLVNDGVKRLYENLVMSYRQHPERFDTLLASVLPYVDRPQKLQAIFKEEASGDALAEHRLVEDCIEKVKELYLKRRSSHLSVAVKTEPNQNNLEEFMNIHKQRLGLRKIKENYETED